MIRKLEEVVEKHSFDTDSYRTTHSEHSQSETSCRDPSESRSISEPGVISSFAVNQNL